MALVIEDGSLVDSANSYATVAQARDYALARGVTLSATDSVVEALLIKAADFLEGLEAKFKGSRVDPEQALAWPRDEVFLFSSDTKLPITEIPTLLIKAQCQLAVDAVAIDLQPSGSGREVIRRKVDVIETEYAKTGSNTAQPELTKAMSILEPLLNFGGFGLRTLRV